jgi:2-oxo-4-hydroxy-4-carboxy--5-ureidoimidazoline (OHCU) decarboxylase
MTLDGVPDGAFRGQMAGLFESAPRFLDRLVAARPYGSWEALFAAAERIALAMPEEEQLELINAHPRLGAPPSSVSEHSFREQGYDVDTTAAIAELEQLNAAYEIAIRVPLSACSSTAGRDRPGSGAAEALTRDRATERDRALRDVVAIARDRSTKAATLAMIEVGPNAYGKSAIRLVKVDRERRPIACATSRSRSPSKATSPRRMTAATTRP